MLMGNFSYLGRVRVSRISWRRIQNLVRSYGGGWRRKPRYIDNHLRIITASARTMSLNKRDYAGDYADHPKERPRSLNATCAGLKTTKTTFVTPDHHLVNLSV